MAAKSKFNLKYLFVGDPVNPAKDWFKAIGFGWRIGIIALALGFIIFTFWKAYLKKPPPTQDIDVSAGGKVNIYNAPKKNFYVFTEPYIGVSNRHSDGEIGIRAGIRWEF